MLAYSSLIAILSHNLAATHMMTTTTISCDKCKFKMKSELPPEDDYNPVEVKCPNCHNVSYIVRVEVVSE